MKALDASLEDLSRFHALPISQEIQQLIETEWYDYRAADPVEEHFKHNEYPPQGPDKTLSGFCVLKTPWQDEYYYLLDQRDSGQLFRQHQDEPDFYFLVETLDEAADLFRRQEEGEEPEMVFDEAWKARCRNPVSTPALSRRWNWICSLLTRYGEFEPEGLAEEAATMFAERAFPTPADGSRALQAELPLLRNDPHLAIYWLLQTSLLHQVEERSKVLVEMGSSSFPLVKHFVDRFGSLDLDADWPYIPDFRERRARFVSLMQR